MADEYMIYRLKKDCEEFMLCAIGRYRVEHSVASNEDLLYLYLGQTYDLPQITTETERALVNTSHDSLISCPDYNKPDLRDVLRTRVALLEKEKMKYSGRY